MRLAPERRAAARAAAVAFCDERGLDAVGEIVQYGHAAEFVALLALPGAKSIKLEEALAATPEARALREAEAKARAEAEEAAKISSGFYDTVRDARARARAAPPRSERGAHGARARL